MNLAIFSGGANPPLADATAEILGIASGRSDIARFPDGELHVEIQQSVRASDVYLIQPTGPPPDRNLFELLFLADACRRAGAAELTAVIPYFGYARQDRRARGREAVGARLVADMLGTAGFNRIVAVDLHTTTLEGTIGVAVEHLTAIGRLGNALSASLSPDSVVVSPDLGAVKLAERYARMFGLPMAAVHKVRISGEQVQAQGLIGDVRGRNPVIVDDMISTAGTMAAAAEILLQAGCKPDITVAATHGLFVGPALARLKPLPIRRLLVSDSLKIPSDTGLPIEVVNLAPLLAEAISRLHLGESLSDLIAHS